jgi:hypothetical protein
VVKVRLEFSQQRDDVRPSLHTLLKRYNFVLSAALDGGTTICSLVIFLALQLPNHSGFALLVLFPLCGTAIAKKKRVQKLVG